MKEAGGFQKYLDNMRLSSTWGDGTMIETAMRFYERPIIVFSELESRPSIISYTGITADAKPIFLGYTETAKDQGLNHYVSLIPKDGMNVVSASPKYTIYKPVKETAAGVLSQDLSSGSSQFEEQHSQQVRTAFISSF